MAEGSDTALLELIGISKSFGGVQALRDVDFSLRLGEIHGLVGENGAGKSTLMKIVAGVHHDFHGAMRLDGKDVHFRSARDALDAGVGMVHQELSIVPDLTVAENVFLGAQPVTSLGTVDWKRMVRESREHLAGLGIDVDPTTRIGELPIGLQQLIELARVLFSGARIIILDEPTSALSPPEVELLFTTLRRLRDSGRSIVFISHFLDDILRISDTVTIFRNGRKVLTAPVADTSKREVIEQMIGVGHRELEESYTGEIKLDTKFDAPIVLETEGLTFGRSFHGISLKVRAGEVLGIYGFMGCGQIELARAMFGKITAAGTLRLEGKPTRLTRTSIAREKGIAYLPESRRAMLFYHEPLYKNMSISILKRISNVLLKPASERRIARGHVENLRIRTPSVDQLLGNLSGGNQQKVALAKWLTHAPKVLILSEPTRGMDVGAKEDVVRIVRGLRDRGIGVVVVSTEPETVLALADRILVMKRGEIVREFAGDTVSKDRLLEAA
jgi:ribose transport system ATP-binding protein